MSTLSGLFGPIPASVHIVAGIVVAAIVLSVVLIANRPDFSVEAESCRDGARWMFDQCVPEDALFGGAD